MLNFLILLFFFIYNLSLFLISNIFILSLILIFNTIISFILKNSIKRRIKSLLNNFIFISFVIVTNLFFSNIKEALLTGVRLFLVIDFTYIISSYFDSNKIREAFYYLFYPLKIFKIDINALTLAISITLAFIPILTDEARIIKLSLKNKGFDFNFVNLVTRPHIYLITFLNGLFDRVDELEKSLLIKGF